MQNRLWSIGEFARQRTEGKSWFWDPQESRLRNPVEISGDQHWIELHRVRVSDALIVRHSSPASDHDEGRSIELVRYRSIDSGSAMVSSLLETAEDSVHNTLQKTEPN